MEIQALQSKINQSQQEEKGTSPIKCADHIDNFTRAIQSQALKYRNPELKSRQLLDEEHKQIFNSSNHVFINGHDLEYSNLEIQGLSHYPFETDKKQYVPNHSQYDDIKVSQLGQEPIINNKIISIKEQMSLQNLQRHLKQTTLKRGRSAAEQKRNRMGKIDLSKSMLITKVQEFERKDVRHQEVGTSSNQRNTDLDILQNSHLNLTSVVQTAYEPFSRLSGRNENSSVEKKIKSPAPVVYENQVQSKNPINLEVEKSEQSCDISNGLHNQDSHKAILPMSSRLNTVDKEIEQRNRVRLNIQQAIEENEKTHLGDTHRIKSSARVINNPELKLEQVRHIKPILIESSRSLKPYLEMPTIKNFPKQHTPPEDEIPRPQSKKALQSLSHKSCKPFSTKFSHVIYNNNSTKNQTRKDLEIFSRKISGLNIEERKAIRIQEMKESTEHSKDHMINMVVDLDHYIAKVESSSRERGSDGFDQQEIQLSHRLMKGNIHNMSKSAKSRVYQKSLYDADIIKAMRENQKLQQDNFEFIAQDKQMQTQPIDHDLDSERELDHLIDQNKYISNAIEMAIEQNKASFEQNELISKYQEDIKVHGQKLKFKQNISRTPFKTTYNQRVKTSKSQERAKLYRNAKSANKAQKKKLNKFESLGQTEKIENSEPSTLNRMSIKDLHRTLNQQSKSSEAINIQPQVKLISNRGINPDSEPLFVNGSSDALKIDGNSILRSGQTAQATLSHAFFDPNGASDDDIKLLNYNSSYQIINTCQKLQQKGIEFAQLTQQQKIQLLEDQHKILESIQRTINVNSQPDFKAVSKNDSAIYGSQSPVTNLKPKIDLEANTDKVQYELNSSSTVPINHHLSDKSCKNAGVGTDELHPLSPKTQLLIKQIGDYSQGGEQQAFQSFEHLGPDSNNTLVNQELNTEETRIMRIDENKESFNILSSDPTPPPGISEQTFSTFLNRLSDIQKQYLYERQLQQAYEYLLISHTYTETENSLHKQMSSHQLLSGQFLPRVIIKNCIGPNKIVYINPISGQSSDLLRKQNELQQVLKINGEGVEVKKGTGPGSAMGVLSAQHKLKLLNAVKSKNDKQNERNAIRNNIQNISMQSIERLKIQQQLLYDQVIKKNRGNQDPSQDKFESPVSSLNYIQINLQNQSKDSQNDAHTLTNFFQNSTMTNNQDDGAINVQQNSTFRALGHNQDTSPYFDNKQNKKPVPLKFQNQMSEMQQSKQGSEINDTSPLLLSKLRDSYIAPRLLGDSPQSVSKIMSSADRRKTFKTANVFGLNVQEAPSTSEKRKEAAHFGQFQIQKRANSIMSQRDEIQQESIEDSNAIREEMRIMSSSFMNNQKSLIGLNNDVVKSDENADSISKMSVKIQQPKVISPISNSTQVKSRSRITNSNAHFRKSQDNFNRKYYINQEQEQKELINFNMMAKSSGDIIETTQQSMSQQNFRKRNKPHYIQTDDPGTLRIPLSLENKSGIDDGRESTIMNITGRSERESLLHDKVKKIVINTSNNPYGTLYSQETLFSKISNQFRLASQQRSRITKRPQIQTQPEVIRTDDQSPSGVSSRSNKFKIANLLHNFQQYQNQQQSRSPGGSSTNKSRVQECVTLPPQNDKSRQINILKLREAELRQQKEQKEIKKKIQNCITLDQNTTLSDFSMSFKKKQGTESSFQDIPKPSQLGNRIPKNQNTFMQNYQTDNKRLDFLSKKSKSILTIGNSKHQAYGKKMQEFVNSNNKGYQKSVKSMMHTNYDLKLRSQKSIPNQNKYNILKMQIEHNYVDDKDTNSSLVKSRNHNAHRTTENFFKRRNDDYLYQDSSFIIPHAMSTKAINQRKMSQNLFRPSKQQQRNIMKGRVILQASSAGKSNGIYFRQ